MSKLIRRFTTWLVSATETNAVSRRKLEQASLLGDSVARYSHAGKYIKRNRVRTPHLLGEKRAA